MALKPFYNKKMHLGVKPSAAKRTLRELLNTQVLYAPSVPVIYEGGQVYSSLLFYGIKYYDTTAPEESFSTGFFKNKFQIRLSTDEITTLLGTGEVTINIGNDNDLIQLLELADIEIGTDGDNPLTGYNITVPQVYINAGTIIHSVTIFNMLAGSGVFSIITTYDSTAGTLKIELKM